METHFFQRATTRVSSVNARITLSPVFHHDYFLPSGGLSQLPGKVIDPHQRTKYIELPITLLNCYLNSIFIFVYITVAGAKQKAQAASGAQVGNIPQNNPQQQGTISKN